MIAVLARAEKAVLRELTERMPMSSATRTPHAAHRPITGPFLSAPEHLARQGILGNADAAARASEKDEVLVADRRGGLTPGQMVDEKLLALMGSSSRSVQRGGRHGKRGLAAQARVGVHAGEHA